MSIARSKVHFGFGLKALKNFEENSILLIEEPLFSSLEFGSFNSKIWNLTQTFMKEQGFSTLKNVSLIPKSQLLWDQNDEIALSTIAANTGTQEQKVYDAYNKIVSVNLTFIDRNIQVSNGVYRNLSFINHSCAPNCKINLESKKVLVASKFIKCGEELTMNYSSGLDQIHRLVQDGRLQKQKAKNLINKILGFNCECSICKKLDL